MAKVFHINGTENTTREVHRVKMLLHASKGSWDRKLAGSDAIPWCTFPCLEISTSLVVLFPSLCAKNLTVCLFLVGIAWCFHSVVSEYFQKLVAEWGNILFNFIEIIFSDPFCLAGSLSLHNVSLDQVSHHSLKQKQIYTVLPIFTHILKYLWSI